MRQQINLYQPAGDGPRRTLSASTVMSGAVVLALALVALWGYGRWEISRLTRGVELVRRQQQAQQSMLSMTSTSNGPRMTQAEIDARVKSLTAEVAVRGRALELLRTGAAGQRTGFAARIEALARRHLDGVWLDHVILGGADNMMSLSGGTFDADLVPRYLQSLAEDVALNGARFDEFIIEQPKPETQAQPTPNEEAAPKVKGSSALRFRAGNKALAASAPAEPT
jgi:hypothetical protein